MAAWCAVFCIYRDSLNYRVGVRNSTYSEYDGLNRLVKFAEINTSSIPESLDSYAITYSYDLNDNISEITYGSELGSEVDAVKYIYADNRLIEIKVKSYKIRNAESTQKQMEKYDNSETRNNSKKVKRGETEAKGTFNYGMWYIKYGLDRNGLEVMFMTWRFLNMRMMLMENM